MKISYPILDNALSLKGAVTKLSGSVFPISILFLVYAAVH